MDSANQEGAGRPGGPWTPGRRNGVLAILCLAAILNYIDRQIITILIQPIKETFGASDTAMGLLAGLIFAGCYSVMSIPLAWLSDRFDRRKVLAACVVMWSVLTSMGGLAQAFWQLAATRVGVAAAESGAVPASHAIIADLYPLKSRGRAIGVLSSAQSAGIGLGVLLGGVLSQAFDWRVSFFIVGLPGALLAIVLFLLPDIPRGMADGRVHAAAPSRFGATVRTLWSMPTYRCLVLTIGLASLPGYGTLAWGPTFLIRVHHMQPAIVGASFGLAVAVSLICGNMLGGYLADLAGRRDLRGYLWIAGAGPLIATPLLLGFNIAPTPQLAIPCLFFGMLTLTLHIPTCYTLGQTLAPPQMRASASVFMGLASVFVGAGVAPLIIGALNDMFAHYFNDEAVRYSLAIASTCAALTAIPAFLATRWVRKDHAAISARDDLM